MATSKQTTKYMKDHTCTKAEAEAHFNKMAPAKKLPSKKVPKLKALPTIDKPRMSDKALIASMSLTELVNAFRSKRAFWKAFATHPNRYAYWEEFVYHVLNAKLPGKTYWLSSSTPGHIIDDKTKEEYGISHLVMGDSTMGMDFLNIHLGRAVAYEAKWEDNEKNLSYNKVANKQYPINKVEKIDKLIYCTNAHQPSREVRKQVDEAGFLLHDEWMSKEAFDLLKTQLNKPADVMKGRLLTPRPSEDNYCLTELIKLKKNCTSHFKTLKRIAVKIFIHWAAGTGKGTLPRLVYDMIFEPLWDYKKSYPTNLVLNPSLAVLEGNLKLNIDHDVALDNNNMHLIYASKTEDELATDQSMKQKLQSKAMFIHTKVDLMECLRENAHRTIFIHTTFHSYKKGPAATMKELGKKFYWAHIDEVHHAVQAKHQPFSACLYDDDCVIDNRCMTSANKKININKHSTAMDMDDPDFADIILYLSEEEAVKKGWKRKQQMINYLHSHDDYPADWVEIINGGCDPLFKVPNTNLVVEHSWYIKAYDLVRFRVEHSNYNHTLCALNRLNRCSDFAEFFKAVYPKLLKEQCGGTQNALYKRLIKAHMYVCRGDNVLNKTNAIPDNHRDSFVFQVNILGEGWSPVGGWVDSTCFIDPRWSPIFIYQLSNRGTRIGDGTKKIHYVIMSHFAEELEQWNEMFNVIETIMTALEIGKEDINDFVNFQPFKKIPNKRKPKKPIGPQDPSDPLDEVDISFFYDEFASYRKEGRYYKYGTIQADIIETYQKNFDDAHMFWVGNTDDITRLTFVEKDTILKHYEFFAQHGNSGNHLTLLNKIISGEDYRVSTQTSLEIVKWRDDMRNKRNTITKEMQTVVTPNISNEELTNIYTTKFGSPNIDVNNLIDNKDKLLSKNSNFFELLISNNKHKIQINKTDEWVLEEIK